MDDRDDLILLWAISTIPDAKPNRHDIHACISKINNMIENGRIIIDDMKRIKT